MKNTEYNGYYITHKKNNNVYIIVEDSSDMPLNTGKRVIKIDSINSIEIDQNEFDISSRSLTVNKESLTALPKCSSNIEYYETIGTIIDEMHSSIKSFNVENAAVVLKPKPSSANKVRNTKTK